MKKPTLLAIALLFAPGPAVAQLAPPDQNGLTFAHVHLNVSDAALAKQIHVELLGGELVAVGPLEMVRFEGMYVLFTEQTPTAGSMGSAMDHYGFKVRDIGAVHERWAAAGYEVQAQFTGTEGYRNSYLIAPDGVRIELQEDPELHRDIIGYHVHFWNTEHESLLDWYVEIFGAEKRQRGRTAATADVPGINMSFARCPNGCAPTAGRAIDHIGFEVDDIEAVVARLEASGIEMEGPVRNIAALGLSIAFFTDPSGVRVELTEGLDQVR